ncbi:Thioredoxin reductase [Novosphingobium sp. CF614]|uniref:NAD(P)-binding domain-containing protein n=1 Tax=Novosphingobium sp. CF614 TaxID=1884364 RepID=UPI0008E4DC9C|nr:NAD(P)-binding domain-containing protein [Novosphingobium sp. CF614]SFG48781.1 Thioredoxin reductase [Novosphingobium sp. CF614]
MRFDPLLLVYALPLVALWGFHVVNARRKSRQARAVLDENRDAGLTEPPSLHPVIDPAICLGCGACARACPEEKVLGIVDGKAMLVEPTACIGHGACHAACPTGAISLVFGTATRGVDIPVLSPQFETSVPGIFIAGELGGMGLIRNAIEQGCQAVDAVAARSKRFEKAEGVLDLVIVGCGPAGIAASLGAMKYRLSFLTVEQSSLGGTVAHYPRGKVVMTSPATLPIVGDVRFGEVTKERLLSFWTDVLDRTGLAPQFEQRVTAIRSEQDHFSVETLGGIVLARSVLLAIGRRGTPRELGVPGEDLDHVVYRLIDPEQYAGKQVLVVGGGDSALEAAAELAGQPGTHVTLSYRGGAYARARARNRDRVRALVETGRIVEMLESEVRAIFFDRVAIDWAGQVTELPCDAVLICAGGLLPTQFLRDTGIAVETKFGTA